MPLPTVKPTNAAPLKVTLYEPNDEIRATFTKNRIPWGVLKTAISLNESINTEDTSAIGSDDMDAISTLVVDAFGGQFTVQDLELYSSIEDVAGLMKTIVAKATAAMGSVNPTPAPKTVVVKTPRKRH